MHHRPVRALTFFAGTVSIAAFLLPTRGWADIYQWEWIDSDDHSLGRRQSDILCPDGAGHDAVPDALLSNLDLTQAWLRTKNLTNADFVSAILTVADWQATAR